MQIGIEFAVLGGHRLDAVSFQGGDQLPVRGLDSVKDRLHLGIGGLAQFRRARRQGAGEIVGDGHHVPGEFGDRILRGLRLFALGAAADIFRFRQGAQPLVAQGFDFGLQHLDRFGGLLRDPGFRHFLFGFFAHEAVP